MIDKQPEISFAEFVSWEQDQTQLHELIGGRIVPVLAASLDHETITVNVISKLNANLEPPCKVFPSIAIIQTISRTREDGYRPDATVSCSPANTGARLYVEQPLIVIEVVSPSNSGPEWNHKLFEYWNTPSIQQLVLIESRMRYVTTHVRDAGGAWLEPSVPTDGILAFTPVAVTMTIDQIYKNTSLT